MPETKQTETRTMLLNVGPAHPAMHGVVGIVVELDGEIIRKADVEIGYLHRGFEKECESATFTQCFPYTDRLNYVSPLINNFAFAGAIEKLMGLKVPERCEYIRVILSRRRPGLWNHRALPARQRRRLRRQERLPVLDL